MLRVPRFGKLLDHAPMRRNGNFPAIPQSMLVKWVTIAKRAAFNCLSA